MYTFLIIFNFQKLYISYLTRLDNKMFVTRKHLYKTIQKDLSNSIIEIESLSIFFLRREYLFRRNILCRINIIYIDCNKKNQEFKNNFYYNIFLNIEKYFTRYLISYLLFFANCPIAALVPADPNLTRRVENVFCEEDENQNQEASDYWS